MKKTLKVGSLFAGVGGICLGLQNAKHPNYNFEIAWANEIDAYACETYRTNFTHTLLEGDIELILEPHRIYDKISNLEEILPSSSTSLAPKIRADLTKLKSQAETNYYDDLHKQILAEKIDVLNGGFPCQAFSIAGAQKGFEDERGNLFLSIIKLINLVGDAHGKPRFLLLENVKNLTSHDNGRTYSVIKSKLEDCGYIIKERVFNTMVHSDLPQNRERIYIVGFLNKSDADNFTFFDDCTSAKNDVTADERILKTKSILTSDNVDSKYYYTKSKYNHYFLSEEEHSSLGLNTPRINLTEDIVEQYQFYQLRRGMYVRKNKSNVCPTLTANMGTGGHNVPLILTSNGIRKLTPTETFNLQGFPVGDGYKLPTTFNNRPYSDANLYKQAGNAVSVPVVTLIAEELLKIIK